MSILPTAVYLDSLRLSDAPALYRIANHPDFFYPYLNENRLPAWRGVLRFLGLELWARLRRPRHWLKAIRAEGHGLIGCALLLDLHVRANGMGEIAYFIDPRFQGQSLVSRSAVSLARWAQQRHGLQRLYAHVDPDNAASIAILRKLGMTVLRDITASQSGSTDRHGNPRPRKLFGHGPVTLAGALATIPATQDYPVR